ncbi:MAG: acylneuraminate cytidylyltransferase family protein, partial [Patescibacteria group bacterium]
MNKIKKLAIISARAGSKRLPNKNIRNFLGKPLIAYAIKQALSCNFIDRVIVNTDSPKIAEIALKYGAEVPFLRPKHLATDTAQEIDSILYVVNKLK